MNAHDDFEDKLRGGLAILAREAVPGSPGSVTELPPVRPASSRNGRRFETRLLAAGIAVAIVTASVMAAVALRSESSTERLGEQPSWTEVAFAPLSARSSQVALFTGREVIVWGGRSDPSSNVASAAADARRTPRHALEDGAAYDVAADRWRVLPRAPIAGRYDALAVWTGTQMLVVGGRRDNAEPDGDTRFLRDGAAYDPAHDRWRRLPDAPGCPAIGAWSGTRLVVAGTCADVAGARPVFASYDPVRNRWDSLPKYPANQFVAAGGRVYAWNFVTTHGAVFDERAHRWTELPPLPAGRRVDSLAVSFDGHLAVSALLQKPSDDPPRDHATVDVLDGGRWHHSESTEVEPLLADEQIASSGDAIVWSAGPLGLSVFTRSADGVQWSQSGDAPVRLGAVGEALLAIGPGRFFAWGGRLAGTEDDPTNRPTAQGVILQLP